MTHPDCSYTIWNGLLGWRLPDRLAARVLSWLEGPLVNKFTTSLTISIAATVVTWGVPVRAALQVQVTPPNPELGDTLSVVVQVDSGGAESPTVTVQDKTYTAFPIGKNRFRALLPTTPLDRPGRRQIKVTGSGQVRNLAVNLSDRDFPTQSIWLPPGKDDLETSDYETERIEAFKKLDTPQKFWNGPFLKPNAGEITTVYGVRRYYNGEFADDYYHRGVDYAGAYGSPVIAPAAGRVALVGFESKGFELNGNTIGIDHGQGVISFYLHLSRINVKEGDVVQAGQVIGALGDTGISTGPHLHWGLYVHGESVDPVPWRYEGFE